MIIVGLTGGMGSGKTTAANFFKKLGVPVYIADTEAKKLMHTDLTIKKALISNFGEKSFENNTLNTSYLAELVFKDEEKLKLINSIVHPAVRQHFKEYLKTQDTGYIIFENAILFENGFDKICDFIITIVAPLETRILRIQERDGLEREQIMDRISKQWDDELKIQKSDFIIYSDTIKTVEQTVIKIHLNLLKIIESTK